MESTNYIQRAKALIKSAAYAGALVVIPLAAAVTAHASTAFPLDNIFCTTTDVSSNTSDFCPGGAVPFASGGVLLFTQAPTSYGQSGGSLAMGLSGPVTGDAIAVGDLIPLSWDFVLDTGSTDTTNWNLEFDLGTAVGGSDVALFQTSGSIPGGNMEVSGTVIVSSLVATSFLAMNVDLSWTGPSTGTGFTANVPESGSFDIGRDLGPAPEPGTVALLGSGLAWLGWRANKRRKGSVANSRTTRSGCMSWSQFYAAMPKRR